MNAKLQKTTLQYRNALVVGHSARAAALALYRDTMDEFKDFAVQVGSTWTFDGRRFTVKTTSLTAPPGTIELILPSMYGVAPNKTTAEGWKLFVPSLTEVDAWTPHFGHTAGELTEILTAWLAHPNGAKFFELPKEA